MLLDMLALRLIEIPRGLDAAAEGTAGAKKGNVRTPGVFLH